MPVYKNKDGQWFARVNYTDPLGKYKSKTRGMFATKREAVEAESQLNLDLRNGSIPTVGGTMTFGAIYNEFYEWKKENVKTTTLITYPSLWAHCTSLADKQINKLTLVQYRAFKESLPGDMSIERKNKVHKFLRQLSDYSKQFYGVRCEAIELAGGFKDPNKIRTKNVDFYTFDEFNKFISKASDNIYHTLFMVLYYQGLRIGEACALTWEDIDFKKHKMFINKSATTKVKGIDYLITSTKKTASDRILPIETETEQELADLLNYWKGFTNFESNWFVFGGPRPLAQSNIHRVKKEYSTNAEVKNIRIHDFRHSCASFLISIGCDPSMVQGYLGHASLKITLDTYSHLYPSKLETAADMIRSFKK